MSIQLTTKARSKREARVCRAAVKWAEFMELRVDKFRWSNPERKLYEQVTKLLKGAQHAPTD